MERMGKTEMEQPSPSPRSARINRVHSSRKREARHRLRRSHVANACHVLVLAVDDCPYLPEVVHQRLLLVLAFRRGGARVAGQSAHHRVLPGRLVEGRGSPLNLLQWRPTLQVRRDFRTWQHAKLEICQTVQGTPEALQARSPRRLPYSQPNTGTPWPRSRSCRQRRVPGAAGARGTTSSIRTLLLCSTATREDPSKPRRTRFCFDLSDPVNSATQGAPELCVLGAES